MSEGTCIRKAAWVIAWDAAEGSHCYLRDVDVAFAGDSIECIGSKYDDAAATEIDGRHLMVMPGLVDVHCHPYNQSLYKGVREELGNPHFYGSGLYDYMHLFVADDEAKQAAAEYAYCELLLSGTTTLVDLSSPYDGWVELLAKSGIRGCLAPMYRSASWRVRDGRELIYDWDEPAGRRSFDDAIALVETAESHANGRLFGMVSPGQIDTCTEELLRDSIALARQTGRPFQIHMAQTVAEHNVMTRRHNKTPVQWARDVGILGPESSIGHGLFLDHHSWIHWPTSEDLGILAETGTSVAHCPTVFSRYGQVLQSFGEYRREGVNIGLGTDTFPHNMIEEMRTAVILGRVAAENAKSIDAAAAFHAATVGGARLLGRDDIGRLAPGAKADLVLVDLTQPLMRPVRDPLRSLIYTAAERAVRDVYVDGTLVVEGGRVLTLDIDDAAERLETCQRRIEAKVPERDDAGRRADEVSPLSLPLH